MSEPQLKDGDKGEEIRVLNEIFKDVITDAFDLISDLNWGVKTYLFFGLVQILFGIQFALFMIEYLQGLHVTTIFIVGVMLFAGTAQILNFLRLRKKYARLFAYQDDLKRS
ncbi:MAG: hypothetical protein NWF13_03350 [Candidatus Bathyarchaeota archaeon]|nr:hypothetical protein [Candidatus Bathyarchaeota archaeon]